MLFSSKTEQNNVTWFTKASDDIVSSVEENHGAIGELLNAVVKSIQVEDVATFLSVNEYVVDGLKIRKAMIY